MPLIIYNTNILSVEINIRISSRTDIKHSIESPSIYNRRTRGKNKVNGLLSLRSFQYIKSVLSKAYMKHRKACSAMPGLSLFASLDLQEVN